MKKTAMMILAMGMTVISLAACGGSGTEVAAVQQENTIESQTQVQQENAAASRTTGQTEDQQQDAAAFEGPIKVISREDGSGTRGAFVELFGVEVKNDAGEKVDMTTEEAEITNSTSVMMTTVAGNVEAIGYISLGSLNDTVKAVEIDGAEATVENIKSGSYRIARPFNIATMEGVSDEAADFITFMMSEQGQAVIEDNGYISQGNAGTYTASGQKGKIVVGGSSSVTPVMEKLKEAYVLLNPDVIVEVQQSDSTTGMTAALEGVCDIGMASRALKESELEKGLQGTTIAMDGIAVIVNKECPVERMTSETVRGIYTGELVDWSEVQ